jgi:hypothetical protein
MGLALVIAHRESMMKSSKARRRSPIKLCNFSGFRRLPSGSSNRISKT